MSSAGDIHVEAVSSVDDELVAAFGRLLPQLSRGAPVPTRDAIREIVEAAACTVLIARDGRASGHIVGMLTLVVFRIPTGVRAWIEDVVVDEQVRGRGLGEAPSQEAIRQAVGRDDPGQPDSGTARRSAAPSARRFTRRSAFSRAFWSTRRRMAPWPP